MTTPNPEPTTQVTKADRKSADVIVNRFEDGWYCKHEPEGEYGSACLPCQSEYVALELAKVRDDQNKRWETALAKVLGAFAITDGDVESAVSKFVRAHTQDSVDEAVAAVVEECCAILCPSCRKGFRVELDKEMREAGWWVHPEVPNEEGPRCMADSLREALVNKPNAQQILAKRELREALVNLKKNVELLKHNLAPEGEYSICRKDGEMMGLGDTMPLGSIMYKIDELLVDARRALGEKEATSEPGA